MVIASSQKKPSGASPEIAPRSRRQKAASPVLASSLSGEEQIRVVQECICRDACVECGAPRSEAHGFSNFCAACLTGYPKTVDVEEAYDFGGWKWAVIQKGPAIPGLGLFDAMRIGIYEYEGRSRLIAFGLDTFAKAKAAALKDHDRALNRAGMYL